MKTILSVLLLALAVGCATFETTAYRIIGSTAIAVDGAMTAWGDYVRSGQATPEQEARARAAYERYQTAMRSARIAVTAWKQAGGTEPRTALESLGQAADAVIAIVRELLPTELRERVKVRT